jgi:hypothetical protein
VEPVRQHMDQEAANELAGLKGHRLPAVVIPVDLMSVSGPGEPREGK